MNDVQLVAVVILLTVIALWVWSILRIGGDDWDYCPHCFYWVRKDARRCPRCGRRLR